MNLFHKPTIRILSLATAVASLAALAPVRARADDPTAGHTAYHRHLAQTDTHHRKHLNFVSPSRVIVPASSPVQDRQPDTNEYYGHGDFFQSLYVNFDGHS